MKVQKVIQAITDKTLLNSLKVIGGPILISGPGQNKLLCDLAWDKVPCVLIMVQSINELDPVVYSKCIKMSVEE